MSRVFDRAPIAVTSDGVVLLNAALFDVPRKLKALLEAARRQPGAVFIGVRPSPQELALILERLYDATYEAGSICTGTRQRRRSERAKRSGR